MRDSRLYVVPVDIAVLTASLAFAAETKVKLSDFSSAVEKTIQEQSTRATILGFSKEVEKWSLSNMGWKLQSTVTPRTIRS